MRWFTSFIYLLTSRGCKFHGHHRPNQVAERCGNTACSQKESTKWLIVITSNYIRTHFPIFPNYFPKFSHFPTFPVQTWHNDTRTTSLTSLTSPPGFLSQGVLVLQELRDFLPELRRDLILRHVGAQQAELGVFIFLRNREAGGVTDMLGEGLTWISLGFWWWTFSVCRKVNIMATIAVIWKTWRCPKRKDPQVTMVVST